jgi:hypothetical protein
MYRVNFFLFFPPPPPPYSLCFQNITLPFFSDHSSPLHISIPLFQYFIKQNSAFFPTLAGFCGSCLYMIFMPFLSGLSAAAYAAVILYKGVFYEKQ